MATKRMKKSSAIKVLEKASGGPLRLAGVLRAVRMSKYMTQQEFADLLGISRAHLCDVEMGRRRVSVERAALFARKVGRLEAHWVELALQEEVDEAELRVRVHVEQIATV